MNDQGQWYAGVDWASRTHCVFLTDSEGRKIGERTFTHGGEGLAEMAAFLMAARAPASPGASMSPSKSRTGRWSRR